MREDYVHVQKTRWYKNDRAMSSRTKGRRFARCADSDVGLAQTQKILRTPSPLSQQALHPSAATPLPSAMWQERSPTGPRMLGLVQVTSPTLFPIGPAFKIWNGCSTQGLKGLQYPGLGRDAVPSVREGCTTPGFGEMQYQGWEGCSTQGLEGMQYPGFLALLVPCLRSLSLKHCRSCTSPAGSGEALPFVAPPPPNFVHINAHTHAQAHECAEDCFERT